MHRSSVLAVVAVASALALAPVFMSAPAAATPPAIAAAVPFSIVAAPPLSPAFSVTTPNYVVACAGHATTHLTATGSGVVVVGGERFQARANLKLHLVPGQSLTVAGGGHSYVIRCLPADFPSYTSTVTGKPQTTGLLVTPTTSFTPASGNYVIVFDAHGVPVWWYRDANVPIDAKFLGPSTIGWASGNSSATGGDFEIRGLDGTLEHTVGGPGLTLDEHDMQRLPNGNYLGIIDVPRKHVDLSLWGQSADATITDNVIVQLNSANQIVWSWSLADHVDVVAENVNWRDQFPDVFHMNSVQYINSKEIVFSARHLDAVYAINPSTGAIIWKLGGSPVPQSLAVAHDQYASVQPSALFSGQHDARILPGGALTVQDNGTRQGRAVRALRFTIDLATKTATEVEQMSDARFATPALCCGAVDKLPTGDWLTSWGSAQYAGELTRRGTPVLTVSYAPYFSYRVAPVTAPIGALRNGMDAMVPPLRLATPLASG